MIVCTECGERQGDDVVFCGRCGAFLEWEGERIETPGAAKAPERAVAAETAVATEDELSVWELAAAGATSEPASAATPEPAPDPTPEPSGSVSMRQPGEVRRRPGHADPGNSEESIVTRQPDEVRRRPSGPAPRYVEQLPSGSLICGKCATGNAPDRRFCLKCGYSLEWAKVVERPPWWRRLLSRERTYRAGARRRPRRGGRWAFRLVLLGALAVLVLALLGPLRPSIVGAYQWVMNTIAGPQQVRTTDVTASATSDGHEPLMAFDGANNTYWSAPPEEDAPFLQATMTEPVHLVAVGITPGTSLQTPEFLAGPRAQVIEIAAGTGEEMRVERFTLEPNPGFQKLEVDLPGVTVVTVAVVSGAGATEQEAAAITEIELYARR